MTDSRLLAEIAPVSLFGPFNAGIALSRFTFDDFHHRSYLGEFLRKLKNNPSESGIDQISRVIVHILQSNPLPHRPDTIITLPDTVRERRFSPTARIADRVAAEFGWSTYHDIIYLKKGVTPQKDRSLEERRADTRSRYDLRPDSTLKGKSLLLFDDIYVSGQSLNEAAKLVRQLRPGFLKAIVLTKIICL